MCRVVDPLIGVLHLAGRFEQRAVTDYSLQEWRSGVEAKILGGWVLHRLALQHSAASFVSFSSVNGYFGGSMSGAYSAANAFLDALARHQRRSGIDAHSLAWSMWDEIGMSEGYDLKALTAARGYRGLDPGTGLRFFDLVRTLDGEPHVLIGADHNAPWVRSHMSVPARALHRLAASVELVEGADIGALHAGAANAAHACGVADSWVLRAAGAPAEQTAGFRSSQDVRRLEEVLVAVWCRILERDHVGIDENFFDLGGHSLLLVQAQVRTNQELGCQLSVVDLLSHPSVRALARHLAETGFATDMPRGLPSDVRPSPALERARQQAERQRDARASRRATKEDKNKGTRGDV